MNQENTRKLWLYNLIAGKNGAGKSSIRAAIAKVRKP